MIVPPGFAEVTVRLNLTGDPEEQNCVFGVEVQVPPYNQAAADNVSDVCATFFRQMIGTTYTYQGVRIRVGNDGGDLLFESVVDAGVGTSSSATLPQNCAWFLRKGTGLGGRANAGRMFIPGVPEAATNNAGVIDSAALAAAQTDANTFLTDLAGIDQPMVLLHSSSLNTPDPVISMVVDDVLATQRRRLR